MNPSSGVSTTTGAPARPFAVLVVGTRNVCRSPAAERLLRARLGEHGDVVILSAGTEATADGDLPAPLVEHLGSVGADADAHEARELDPELVRSADVVLTATRQERAAVVRTVPSAIRRTFTLRELARVARALGPEVLPEGDVAGRLSALVDAAARHRTPTSPRAAGDDDLLDPYGRDEAAYATAFDQVLAAVEGIAETVRPELAAEHPAPGHDERPLPAVRAGRSVLRTVALAALVSLLLLVVAGTTGALVAVDRLDSRVQRFPDPFADLPTRPPAPAPPAAGSTTEPALTVLVLGASADDAGGDGASGDAAGPGGAAGTDVVLLAHVAADRRSAQVVALPPDLHVGVPGSEPAPLRSAAALGGPPGAVQAVEQLTGVRVDHVALTDAETFARVTETLGGVDLDVTDDVVVRGRVAVPTGRHRLTGGLALAWMQDTDDDAARAERGQLWLRAILDRLGHDDVRSDPTTWLALLDVLSGSVAVDEGLDRGAMLGLLTSLRTLRPGDVQVVTAPTTAGTAADGSPTVVPDPGPFAALMDALRSDTLDEHLAGAPG
ncbi:LCP family protein [Cellulomonas sp. NS3]|uniref:LCP family glycopolymer transferase n=1 Tax=Cellulomonas sp. NS3 TaxID=2973977 RepID=UPI002161CF8C|nr:LCP family protein [Cellulomonas sp. NS3]